MTGHGFRDFCVCECVCTTGGGWLERLAMGRDKTHTNSWERRDSQNSVRWLDADDNVGREQDQIKIEAGSAPDQVSNLWGSYLI